MEEKPALLIELEERSHVVWQRRCQGHPKQVVARGPSQGPQWCTRPDQTLTIDGCGSCSVQRLNRNVPAIQDGCLTSPTDSWDNWKAEKEKDDEEDGLSHSQESDPPSPQLAHDECPPRIIPSRITQSPSRIRYPTGPTNYNLIVSSSGKTRFCRRDELLYTYKIP